MRGKRKGEVYDSYERTDIPTFAMAMAFCILHFNVLSTSTTKFNCSNWSTADTLAARAVHM